MHRLVVQDSLNVSRVNARVRCPRLPGNKLDTWEPKDVSDGCVNGNHISVLLVPLGVEMPSLVSILSNLRDHVSILLHRSVDSARSQVRDRT